MVKMEFFTIVYQYWKTVSENYNYNYDTFFINNFLMNTER